MSGRSLGRGDSGLASVGVDAAHFLSFGRSPLYLIQRWLLRHGVESVLEPDMWRGNIFKA